MQGATPRERDGIVEATASSAVARSAVAPSAVAPPSVAPFAVLAPARPGSAIDAPKPRAHHRPIDRRPRVTIREDDETGAPCWHRHPDQLPAAVAAAMHNESRPVR